MAVEDDVLRLERLLLQKQTRASAETLGALLAEEFVEFGSSGHVYDKRAIIEALPREAQDASPAERSAHDMRLVHLADDLRLVTYRAVRRLIAEDREVHTLRSSLWKR